MECELITMTTPTPAAGNEHKDGPQYPAAPQYPAQPQYPTQPQYAEPAQAPAQYPQYAQHPQHPPYAQQQPYSQPFPHTEERPQVGVLSIITLATSVALGFASVVLGVFALRQNWKNGTRGSVMAWIGICIGAVVGVAWSVFIMISYQLAAAT